MIIIILFLTACKQKTKVLGCATKDQVPTCGTPSTIAQPFIFKAKCATCHMLDKNTTGPKLQTILDRVPSEKWFDDFVRNQDSLHSNKDPHTLEIEKWSPVDFVHNFTELNEQQLSEIKDYLDQK